MCIILHTTTIATWDQKSVHVVTELNKHEMEKYEE
jgi:hypothetical protein